MRTKTVLIFLLLSIKQGSLFKLRSSSPVSLFLSSQKFLEPSAPSHFQSDLRKVNKQGPDINRTPFFSPNYYATITPAKKNVSNLTKNIQEASNEQRRRKNNLSKRKEPAITTFDLTTKKLGKSTSEKKTEKAVVEVGKAEKALFKNNSRTKRTLKVETSKDERNNYGGVDDRESSFNCGRDANGVAISEINKEKALAEVSSLRCKEKSRERRRLSPNQIESSESNLKEDVTKSAIPVEKIEDIGIDGKEIEKAKGKFEGELKDETKKVMETLQSNYSNKLDVTKKEQNQQAEEDGLDQKEAGAAEVLVSDFPEDKTEETNSDEVKLYRLIQRLLKESPLIDGHNDLPWNLRKFLHGQLLEFDFNSHLERTPPWSKSAWSHTDLPRLRRGLVGAQFWVAYAPCQSQNLNAVQITLEQIDLIRRLIARYPDDLVLALTAEDIEKAHRAGKIASLIAVEGGHSIGNSLSTLRSFYELGVRYMTLTHTCNTPWADSARPGHKPEHGGLTEFGRAVVLEMNRLGMLVDLSHTSKLTMKDALIVSKAPVIFSHSSAYALCNSSRNVPDDILQELVWNRGIIMVTFYNTYVKCQSQATVGDVADHINYIRGKIGIEHIGIGSDFDGINLTPVHLEDVSKFPNLFVDLARNPNWSNDELKMVAGRNFLRVFKEAENVRDMMQSGGTFPSFERISLRESTGESSRCRSNSTLSSSPIH